MVMEVETISSGNDTVVFAATAADNGKDTITGFTAGATSSGGDVLDVSAFLGSGTTIKIATVNADTTAAEVSSGTNVIRLTYNSNNATDKVKFAATGDYVVLYDSDKGGTNEKTKVYYYTATSANSDIAISSIVADVNLVATTDVNEVTTFTGDNFIA